MPKIRRDGDPKVTVAGEYGPEAEQLPDGRPLAFAEQDSGQDDELEGGEQPSAGSSSSTSTEKQQTSGKPNKADSRKPAQTTENHSDKDPKAGSTARSTGGSGTD